MANFNTVAGCFLASALFALVVGKVSNAVVDPHHLEKPALAVTDEAPAEAAAAAAGGRTGADRSEARRRQCRERQGAVHEALLHLPHDRQGRRQQGRPQPVEHGRPQEGEPRGFCYSSGMQAKGGDWTYEDINHMIFKPQAFVKGTKMAFVGVPKEQDRADIIAYLRTMNDNPPPLPK